MHMPQPELSPHGRVVGEAARWIRDFADASAPTFSKEARVELKLSEKFTKKMKNLLYMKLCVSVFGELELLIKPAFIACMPREREYARGLRVLCPLSR
jgi:hypothetical protein